MLSILTAIKLKSGMCNFWVLPCLDLCVFPLSGLMVQLEYLLWMTKWVPHVEDEKPQDINALAP